MGATSYKNNSDNTRRLHEFRRRIICYPVLLVGAQLIDIWTNN